jgi:hypothetical protein
MDQVACAGVVRAKNKNPVRIQQRIREGKVNREERFITFLLNFEICPKTRDKVLGNAKKAFRNFDDPGSSGESELGPSVFGFFNIIAYKMP